VRFINVPSSSSHCYAAGHVTHPPDDGGSNHLRNIGKLPDYTAQLLRRQLSSYSSRENLKSYHHIACFAVNIFA
jgi:hypothetical protein